MGNFFKKVKYIYIYISECLFLFYSYKAFLFPKKRDYPWASSCRSLPPSLLLRMFLLVVITNILVHRAFVHCFYLHPYPCLLLYCQGSLFRRSMPLLAFVHHLSCSTSLPLVTWRRKQQQRHTWGRRGSLAWLKWRVEERWRHDNEC